MNRTFKITYIFISPFISDTPTSDTQIQQRPAATITLFTNITCEKQAKIFVLLKVGGVTTNGFAVEFSEFIKNHVSIVPSSPI